MSTRRLLPLRLRTTFVELEARAAQVNITADYYALPVRGGFSMDRRQVLRAAAATSLALALPRANAQSTRTRVKIALNRAPYDASNAPFLLAEQRGYFAQEDIDVTMSLSKNATDAIRRVASNEFDFGFVDGSVNMRAAMQSKAPSPVYL